MVVTGDIRPSYQTKAKVKLSQTTRIRGDPIPTKCASYIHPSYHLDLGAGHDISPLCVEVG